MTVAARKPFHPLSMNALYYYADTQNQPVGPVAVEALRSLFEQGVILPATLVIKEGGTEWQALSVALPEFQPKAKIAAPPPLPVQNSASAVPPPITQEQAGPQPIFAMKGVNTAIAVFEDKVEITPKGVLGFLGRGLKGTKTLPFHSISAIQFKEAGAITSGYLQFTLAGGNESRGGLFAAANDENTFMFARDATSNDEARKIKAYIEQRVQETRAPKQTAAPAASNIADELKKLADLKAQGILTDEEFQTAKQRLIG